MERLRGTVRHYAWGALDAIPALLGVPADGRPWAELWFGAHPSAPASIERDGQWRRLDEVIDDDPVGELGPSVIERFGPRLPFLVKVLAAGEPLSLQAHPSADQARAGFAREDQLGIPRTAEHRVYRDQWPKPELLCALDPFDALCGFRPVAETLAVLDALAVAELQPFAEVLRRTPTADGLRYLLGSLLTMPAGEQALLVSSVADAADHLAVAWPLERMALELLYARYPGDVGVVVALLLNCLRLAPGEAVYLGAGNLHSYLRGTGVEVMATSDNVLRGGLTPKHVDVPELMRTVDTSPLGDPVVRAHDGHYDTPAPEFHLRRVDVTGSARVDAHDGPQILWCSDGDFAGLRRGEACFLRHGSGATLVGAGSVFQASVCAETPV
jgi:mannose-6-phosphate isomerase